MNCKQVAIVNPWIYLGIQFGEHRRALHWHAALVLLQLEPARSRVQMGGVVRKRFYICKKCPKSMYCTYRCDEKNIPTIIRKTKTWDIIWYPYTHALEYSSKPTLVLQQAAYLGEKWVPFNLCSFLAIGYFTATVDPGSRSGKTQRRLHIFQIWSNYSNFRGCMQ